MSLPSLCCTPRGMQLYALVIVTLIGHWNRFIAYFLFVLWISHMFNLKLQNANSSITIFWIFLHFLFRETEKYKLRHPSSFHYLNQSNYYQLDVVNEREEYLSTQRVTEVGIGTEEQVWHFVVWKIKMVPSCDVNIRI